VKKYKEAIQPFIKAHELGVADSSQLYVFRIAQSYARVGDADNALLWLEKVLVQMRYNINEKQNIADNQAFASLKENPRFLTLLGITKQAFTRDEGWRFNVDYLLTEIKRVNPVYSKQALPLELVQSAERLKAQIPKFSDAQILWRCSICWYCSGNLYPDNFLLTIP